jgi:hypothetical protein
MVKSKTQAGINWKNRTLCSDGNCIGVIGDDGICKECGTPYKGKITRYGPTQPMPEYATKPETEPEEPQNIADSEPDDTGWENRTLCSDESCIGIIGGDGLCKECGTPLKVEN